MSDEPIELTEHQLIQLSGRIAAVEILAAYLFAREFMNESEIKFLKEINVIKGDISSQDDGSEVSAEIYSSLERLFSSAKKMLND